MSCLSDDIPVSCNAGATGLPLCKAGCSGSGNIDWSLCGFAGGPVFLHAPLTALSLQLLMFAEFLAGPGNAVCDLVSQVLTNHRSGTLVFNLLFHQRDFSLNFQY